MFGRTKKHEAALNGAWEEPGVIGTRIEIDGTNLTILWRNAPVLETTFRISEKDDGLELIPKENGMAYSTDEKPYATVTRLFWHDGNLEFDELFPISGPSSQTLKKTMNSRYGNVTICDEVLEELQGRWVEVNGGEYFRISFRGDRMTLTDNGTRAVHAVRPNGYASMAGGVMIIDADPSVYEWRGLGNMTYDGAVIRLQMFVCDAEPMFLTFKKAD